MDVFPFREPLNKLVNGVKVRRSEGERYLDSPILQVCLEFMKQALQLLTARVCIVWGDHPKERVRNILGHHDIIVRQDDCALHLFFLNHPERLMRWSDDVQLAKNARILDQIEVEFPQILVSNHLLEFRKTVGRVVPRIEMNEAQLRASFDMVLKNWESSKSGREHMIKMATKKVFSAEARAKMSASAHARWAQRRAAGTQSNGPMSDETKAKISAAKLGKSWYSGPMSDDHKAKISVSNKGKTISAETRAKMTASQKARWEERKSTGKKVSAQRKVRVYTPKSADHKAKISMAMSGKKASAETRAKMTASQKAKWVERRIAQ